MWGWRKPRKNQSEVRAGEATDRRRDEGEPRGLAAKACWRGGAGGFDRETGLALKSSGREVCSVRKWSLGQNWAGHAPVRRHAAGEDGTWASEAQGRGWAWTGGRSRGALVAVGGGDTALLNATRNHRFQ